jgi:hypothetical protein
VRARCGRAGRYATAAFDGAATINLAMRIGLQAATLSRSSVRALHPARAIFAKVACRLHPVENLFDPLAQTERD